VTIELSAAEGRDLDAGLITERWRDKVGEITGARELNFFNRFGRWGSDIDIRISGTDLAEMDRVSTLVQDHLKTYEGVFDVHGSIDDGKSEIQLKVKPAALTLGLSEEELGRQVREAFYGAEAQRIQRGRDDVRVMVRYPRVERESLHNLETMKIRTGDGREVPFATVAEVKFGRSFSAIQREDRRRIMSVRASADTIGVDMQRLQDQVEVFLGGLRREHPGIDFSFEGAARDQRESWAGLWWGVGMALFALYALMAMPFKSYFQPLVVMSVIPFCVLGAIGGHLLRGLNLSFFSILGMLAVAGVAVNNGIILVDFINQRREQGMPLREAILEAARARFRAVFLTSATTFVGLLPLIFAQSTQAKLLTPMAVSMGFGVLISTLVTLLLVPLNYSLLEKSRETLNRWFSERNQSPVPAAAE
jgi:multidrug efflux pump subunit AcrB